MNLQQLLDDQTAYYRARAAEYDEWFLRKAVTIANDATHHRFGSI